MSALALKGKTSPKLLTAFSSSLTPQRVEATFGPSLELGPNVTLSVESGELGMSGLLHVRVTFGKPKRDPNVALRWCEGWSRFCSSKNVDQTWKLGVWAWLEILRMLRRDLACSKFA
ncbi:hypothetical protein PIB30_101722 [Stylosanthes scabra]|uniref:Uncharacterized protein n=1 Tax=Stylosanthes scabra TaxID=79078 RepID=A0ABU6UWF6_9FABA|nr:hypothetical protein [Stylosanthes scabra]